MQAIKFRQWVGVYEASCANI